MKKKLETLLLEGDTKGTGIYDNINWHVHFEDDNTSDNSKLISLHESFHSYLNNSTIYGLILKIYTYSFKETSDAKYKEILFSLIEKCTLVHEVFATYLSISVMSPIHNYNDGKIALLEGYREYYQYYDKANELLKGIEGKYLRQHCLTSLLRAILQDKSILDKVLINAQDLDLNKIEKAAFPNARLAVIQQEINNGFWEDVLTTFFVNYTNEEEFALIQNSKIEDKSYKDLIQPKYDLLSENLYAFIYEEVKSVLDKNKKSTLDFNEHLEFINDLLGIANRNYSLKQSKNPFVKNPNPENLEFSILSNFQNEIFYITTSLIRAHFLILSKIKMENWELLRVGTISYEHFFIVVRTPKSLLSQYLFSEDDKKKIESLNLQPLVMIRRSALINGQREIEFFLITHPNEIFLLKKKANIKVVCNISLKSFFYKKWYETWFKTLKNQTIYSVLFNLTPFVHLAQLKSQFDKFYYQTATMIVENKKYNTILLYGRQGNESLLFVMPCSTTTASSINYYIQQNLADDKFIFDKSFSSEVSWQVVVTMGHLFREEHYFDFQVLPNDY